MPTQCSTAVLWCRIPHRRFCREKVQGFDGVTGQPEEVCKLNYFVLEREGNNHSKCRRPSLLITSSADPKWKRGKAKVRPCKSQTLLC